MIGATGHRDDHYGGGKTGGFRVLRAGIGQSNARRLGIPGWPSLLVPAIVLVVTACGTSTRRYPIPNTNLGAARQFTELRLYYAGRHVGDYPLTDASAGIRDYRPGRAVGFLYGT